MLTNACLLAYMKILTNACLHEALLTTLMEQPTVTSPAVMHGSYAIKLPMYCSQSGLPQDDDIILLVILIAEVTCNLADERAPVSEGRMSPRAECPPGHRALGHNVPRTFRPSADCPP